MEQEIPSIEIPKMFHSFQSGSYFKNCLVCDQNLIEDDDHSDENYQKTLLCKNHNTSGGKNNKFVGLCKKDLMCLFKNDEIRQFLEEHKYI